jgi:uncharacterized protein
MTNDLIRYDLIVQDAMRGVMRKVLGEVAEMGVLPGEHHFTISFRTDAPGVKISRRLAEQWPRELTIILQHQFSNLHVDDAGFGVTLSFRSVPESLYIPYDAVTMFADPSVEFGVKFNVEDDREEPLESPRRPPSVLRAEPRSEPTALAPKKQQAERSESPSRGPQPAAEAGAGDKIVSIDAFRKKP